MSGATFDSYKDKYTKSAMCYSSDSGTRAMAYEAQKIKEVLENPKLPMMVGAENRERMLKMLGVDVAGDYVRLERNLVQYIVAIMEYPKTAQDQSEVIYLNAMLQLGSSIPWSKLVSVRPVGGKAQRF